MNYSVILSIVIILLTVFQLGRWSRGFKISQLKKENQMLRDLLNKALRLEELNAQTYLKVAHEYTRANHQPQ